MSNWGDYSEDALKKKRQELIEQLSQIDTELEMRKKIQEMRKELQQTRQELQEKHRKTYEGEKPRKSEKTEKKVEKTPEKPSDSKSERKEDRWTIKNMQSVLDRNQIEYNKSLKKDDLIELVRKSNLVRAVESLSK